MSRFVVGLTGGIGSGKTAVSDNFHRLGIDIVDADVCARTVVEPGTPALKAIADRFGQSIIQPNGELDRAKLRQHIFSHPVDKDWLNQLLHPLIREQMLAEIEASTSVYCILVAPLLIENNMQSMVDRVLVVDTTTEVQQSRALARDGSTPETIKAIMQSQCSREQRLAAADDVIDNSGALSALKSSVSSVHEQYVALASKSSNT